MGNWNTKKAYYLTAETENSSRVFYFIEFAPGKMSALKNIKMNKQVDLSKFGKIILSGYGKASAKIIRQIKKEYKVENI